MWVAFWMTRGTLAATDVTRQGHVSDAARVPLVRRQQLGSDVAWPNAFAEKLRAMAEAADLKNRYVPAEPQFTNEPSFYDSWLAAEDPCPARLLPSAHYAPNLDRRIRRSKCYHCKQFVWHR